MHIIDLKTAPWHLPQLADWHHAEWGHLHPGRRVEDLAAQMREYLTDAALPRMLIAVEDGALLGSSSLVASDMDSHPELGPWLANVYVPAAHRGRGLGVALVRAAMALADAQRLAPLYLFTHDQEGFYGALGWSLLRHEDYHGDRVTLMQYGAAD